MLICLLIRGFEKQILYLIMADLKMVTEGELRSAGYTGNSISDNYCPTVENFMSNWGKDGYQIIGINNHQYNELFALSQISEKVRLILFDEDNTYFMKGYDDANPTEGFFFSASTSLTSFTIELYYDERCQNKIDVTWEISNDNPTNEYFIKNGITYRCLIANGSVPYNDTDENRFLYVKIIGEGSIDSETDVFRVTQYYYNNENPYWEGMEFNNIFFEYNQGTDEIFSVIDETKKGWKLAYPDFITVSPTGGTGDAEIICSPKSENNTYEQRTGNIYLMSNDGNDTVYQSGYITQYAKPITSMTIYFKGMKDSTDLNFANDGYTYLYVWDNNDILIKLGNDFNPSVSQRSVTITKDLITKIKNSSSYENVTTADDWKIICTDMDDAVVSDASGFEIMANYVDVKSVMHTIVNAWGNNNESVIIEVSYTETSFTLPSWDLTTGATLGLSDTSHTITFTVTDEDEMGYIFSATNATSFLYLIDPNNGPYDWGTQTGGTKQWRLDIKNNTGSYRYGNVYLMKQDKSIIDSVMVSQNAYVDTSMGELYSIRNNGSNNPIKLRASDVSRTEITSNDITVAVEWAPQTVIGDNSGIYPIFGWSSQSETYIYAEYVPDNLNYNYRIHVISAGVDISGCTFLATNTSSEKLVQITHSILNAGTYHKVVVAYPNSSGYYNEVNDSSNYPVIPSYYSIYVGGIQNYHGEVKGVSYFGRVLLTIGSNKTNWVPYTTNGTTVGWVQKTSSGNIESNTFVTASNYSIGKKK